MQIYIRDIYDFAFLNLNLDNDLYKNRKQELLIERSKIDKVIAEYKSKHIRTTADTQLLNSKIQSFNSFMNSLEFWHYMLPNIRILLSSIHTTLTEICPDNTFNIVIDGFICKNVINNLSEINEIIYQKHNCFLSIDNS